MKGKSTAIKKVSVQAKSRVVNGCAGTSCMDSSGDPGECPYKSDCLICQKWLIKK